MLQPNPLLLLLLLLGLVTKFQVQPSTHWLLGTSTTALTGSMGLLGLAAIMMGSLSG
jgi:hypothetical protein